MNITLVDIANLFWECTSEGADPKYCYLSTSDYIRLLSSLDKSAYEYEWLFPVQIISSPYVPTGTVYLLGRRLEEVGKP